MAYKIPKVSPSALAATEFCPRFRPDGKENEAAVDGTVFHEFMEELVTWKMLTWESYAESRTMSPDMRRMVMDAIGVLQTVVTEPLPVFPNYRLRPVKGNPRKSPLKPGLYPECEVDRGQGRHGYIDLMVVTPEGLVFILDYKTNRVEKDFSLQLAAYACDVNRLCPAHKFVTCQIIAPRLDSDAQLRLELKPDDFPKWNARIAEIEERADRAANDETIVGCPGDQCQYCHWSGMCRYQANVAVETARAAVPTAFSKLVTEGPYAGETLSEQTFTNPATQAQRGLRRACISVLETLAKAVKDDDKGWAETHPGENPPGWKIVVAAGASHVDNSRQADIRAALANAFGFTNDELMAMSVVDKNLVAEYLVAQCGYKKSAAPDMVKKALEPFMVRGATTVRWTKTAKKTASKVGEVVEL